MSRHDRYPKQNDISPEASSGKVDSDLLRFHGEAATSAVEDAVTNYQAPSIIAAGADAQSVSLLTTLIDFMISIVCIKTPNLIERLGLAKKGAVLLAGVNLLTWAPLAFLLFMPRPLLAPIWFAIIWLINIMPGILLSIQRDNWMSSIIPQGMMGRYLGQRMAIRSSFYLAAFCMSGYLLDSITGGTWNGFSAIFVMAFLAVAGYLTIYSFMNDPKKTPRYNKGPKQEEFSFFEFIKDLRERKLGTFVLFVSLFGLTVNICGPLYAVYMLQELKFSYLSFTIITSVEYFARVVSGPFWGRYADKVGNIRVLNLVSRIIPLVPISWIFCSNMAYFAAVQAISGFCWGAYDLCIQNYLFKMAPPSKKLRYIVYNKVLSMFCMAAGGLLSFYLLKGIVPISGSRTLSIFLVSGIFRALVVVAIVPKLIDMAVSYGMPNGRLELDLGFVNRVLTSKHGIYYANCQEETAETSQTFPKAEPGTGTVQSVKEMADPKDGLYYRASEKSYLHDKASHKKGDTSDQPVVSHDGLYYHETAKADLAKTWASLQTGNSLDGPAISHDGIYYRKPEKVSPEKVMASVRKENYDDQPAISRDGMYYRIQERLDLVKASVSSQENLPVQPVISYDGMYYRNQQRLAEHMKDETPPLAKVSKDAARLLNQSGGLYYSPEGWSRYKSDSLHAIVRDSGITDKVSRVEKRYHVTAGPYSRKFTGS